MTVLAKTYKEHSYILDDHECCWQINMMIRVIHIILTFLKRTPDLLWLSGMNIASSLHIIFLFSLSLSEFSIQSLWRQSKKACSELAVMIETSVQFLGRQAVRESFYLVSLFVRNQCNKTFLALFTSKTQQFKMARKSRNALKIAKGANLLAGTLL